MGKTINGRERLINLYGLDVLTKACDYFGKRGEHFTIEKLERQCKKILGDEMRFRKLKKSIEDRH